MFRRKIIFPILENAPPHINTCQMIEVDRLMIEEYHIDLFQMTENAGRNLARLAVNRFRGKELKQVVILAGTGGNGGGVLVAARHLHNWGVKVRVFLTRSHELYTGVPAHQLETLRKLNISATQFTDLQDLPDAGLIIDGLIGYNLKGPPSGRVAELIQWVNRQKAPVLSLDIPSGLDATNGYVYEPVIKATATMTLGLPKTGFQKPGVNSLVGELYLADIGIPPELYKECGISTAYKPIFVENEIVLLW